MSSLGQTWLAVVSVSREHPAGLFVLAFAAVAMVHTAAGLGRTRQWHLLPVVFGLTALVGFLLNPLADANTLADLRGMLTSFETLTLLCIGQFLLLAVALVLGVRLDPGTEKPRGATLLAWVHSIPVPAIAIAMLLIEQGRLGGAPGARPEAVGREVGVVVAGLLTVACVAAMMLPRRWLTMPHQLLSLAMLLACAFVPVLDSRLPEPFWRWNEDSVRLGWQIGLAAGVVVFVGWCWPRGRVVSAFQRSSLRASMLDSTRGEPPRGIPWDC